MVRDLRQAAILIGAAAVIGLGGNALRPEPLPLTGPIEPPPPVEAGAQLAASGAEEALRSWLEGAFFLDVRDRDAWEARRVSGSWSLAAEQFDDRYFEIASYLDLTVPLFLYGAGADSFDVRGTAARLEELGHTDVQLAVCGLDELLAAGLDPAEGPAEEAP